MPSLRYVAAAALLTLVASRLDAQGSLSTQGFGYPPGQFGTRALATGGALAEIDPVTPVNPASITGALTSLIFFQIEPEYRKVTSGGSTQSSSIARYPLIFGALPFGQRWTLSVSSSTLLDRTFETSSRRTSFLGPDTVLSTEHFRSDGSINDLRLAVGFIPRAGIRLGFGLHGLTGSDRLSLTDAFDDTTRYGSVTHARVITYSGAALSVGGELFALDKGSIALSYRRGLGLNTSVQDTTISRANAPDRLGLSAAFTGINGTTLAVRAAHDSWSRMNGLGGVTSNAVDSWDTGAGADVQGPRVGDYVLMLRAGGRWRTLPFQAGGHSVTEQSWSAGLGSSLSQGRVHVDLAAVHSTRSAPVGSKESAWTLSAGLMIRP
ncbi:MAG: hypothetical protein JWO05_2337 [Gemmatimonadetes bacterium]|nr:hypothetical protein [Gemmatimonadota bacterium]